MHKRILLAETSDTVRSVAETVLRQNGFDVIAVSSSQKASEVLELTRPDLIVIGADLQGQGSQPLYKHLQLDSRASAIPMVLLTNPSDTDLPFPSEVLVSKPIEPGELAEKVRVFSGAPPLGEENPQANPLGGETLQDDILDAALGLDRIDVTDSEVMDNTSITSGGGRRTQSPEKLVGFDSYDSDTDGPSDSRKVESIIVKEDSTDIRSTDPSSAPAVPVQGTGKLEIMTDQFGITSPDKAGVHEKDADHDYNWFLNEMKQMSDDASPQPGAEKAVLTGNDSESGSLKTTEPAASLDPITPPPASAGTSHSGGAEKYIDEFKQELEKFRSGELDSVILARQEPTKKPVTDSTSAWEDAVEKLSPEEIRLFTRDLASQLAEKIASKIVNRIDPDKLLHLIKNEILSTAGKPRNR